MLAEKIAAQASYTLANGDHQEVIEEVRRQNLTDAL
jgi:hypothetical protein